MTEKKEDTSDLDFVLDSIKRESWVDKQVLTIYEDCYRRLKKLAKEMGLDTMEMDKARNEVMRLYNQL
jgi:hypothetical protein